MRRWSSDDWTSRPLPFASDGSVLDLAARGSDVWLLGTLRGDSRHDVLARSNDGGRTFVTDAGPCYPGLGGELTPSASNVVWAVCPTGMMAAAARSTDGGTTFTRLNAPPLVNSAAIAPASERVAVLARNGAGANLVRTVDGGATWRRAAGPAGYWQEVVFSDARTGEALLQNGESESLWRTTDGGFDGRGCASTRAGGLCVPLHDRSADAAWLDACGFPPKPNLTSIACPVGLISAVTNRYAARRWGAPFTTATS